MHDLLNDPIIRIEHQQQRSSVCLPELLARLQQGAVDAYPGLRAHQADPWHVFLVQLTAAVMARAELPTHDPAPQDASWWRAQLLALAEGKASAWHLVEPDVAQPAFMQHPWPRSRTLAAEHQMPEPDADDESDDSEQEEARSDDADSESKDAKRHNEKEEKVFENPDQLDILITSKNHDVKACRHSANDVDGWLYGLLTYQTVSGYLGRQYGIVRMNSGEGTRAIVSWVSDSNPARRFCEEVRVVREQRAEIVKMHGYAKTGCVLTWLYSWDWAEHQHSLRDLDPFFIEACRPIRLCAKANGELYAVKGVSKKRQIGPDKPDSGDVGDPWTVLNGADKKKGCSAFTLTKGKTSSGRFTPSLLTSLIFEDDGYRLTALQKPRKAQDPGFFIGSVLVRAGKGKTGGFDRFCIPVPAKAAMSIFAPKDTSARQRAAESAKRLLSDAGNAANALVDALYAYYDAGEVKPVKRKTKSKTGSDKKGSEAKWLAAIRAEFNLAWPQAYFPTLWRVCDESDEQAALREWRQNLATLVQTHLKMATAKLPLSSNRKWLACTQAESKLIGLLHHHHLLEPKTQAAKENP